ncbi:MAG: methylated-DNA--[protein]-cysteine S-methyltransferase [Spirosomataceae bacterium]|jgi:AraC family transcriptional regulator of adaptative response/methylated-DNA-[protein]-cysteine methyltransferase
MDEKHQVNFERISKAIGYIETAFKSQPNLDEIAERVHLSPFHFQRLFKEWAGVSPKRFLQYISLEHAKNLLSDQNSIFDVAFQTGLSRTSRLHDLFVNIEGMTPAEYKNGGKNLVINYSFAESLFGNLIVASTSKGICHMAFEEDESAALQNLIYRFPNAVFQRKLDMIQQDALYVFRNDWSNLPKIKLHLHGTDFQLKVWESLLKIPSGKLSTYGRIAENIGHIGASRAVGTAIGSNPVAFLIPCHRVIQSTGSFGGYRWGTPRKTAIIGWEAAREYQEI